MLQFENPFAFLFLIFIPVYFIFRRIKLFEKVSFPITLSDWKGKTFEWDKGLLKFSKFLSRALFLLGFCSLIIALASPVVLKQERIYISRGSEIVFLIDTSPSMAALDMESETRLDIAKKTILQIVEQMSGTSFGLVSMASEAAAIVPPTLDHSLFKARLLSLQIGEMGDGTAIGTGIATAAYHLTSSSSTKKVLILLTDGENNAGSIHPKSAAKILVENGITLYSVGLGTTGAVPIEYTDSKTGKRYSGYLESQFDETLLKGLASMCNGKYYAAENTATLLDVLQKISKQENTVQTFYYKSSKQKYYDRFLYVTVFLFAAAWVIRRLLMKELV